jgi:uncharacterized protein (TIGR03435 family)
MTRWFSLVLILTPTAFGQSPAKTPEFEVADVKASSSTKPEPGKGRILPGGRIELPNMSIRNLIMAAYDVQENLITGGPGWIDSDRFDIVAKAPADTPPNMLRVMLQPLLADRFKLSIHREDKPMPVYAMVAGKGGPKLEKAAGGQQQCRWNNPGSGLIQRECHNMTMAELASDLPKWGMANVDLPVVDMTETPGAYDFQLQWSTPGKGDAPGATDAGASTIFDAMGQIGLKLEQRKRPVSVIVIDRVERIPAAN